VEASPEFPELAGCEPEAEAEPATRFDSWRRRSATGVVLTAIALGLREALEEKSEDEAIVQYVDDVYGPPTGLDLHLEWGTPEEAWVVVRPWLLKPRDQ
jgi:hypothetical protein